MECSRCHEKRCSKEFPAEAFENCDHPPSICLSCLSVVFTDLGNGIPTNCPECALRVSVAELGRFKAALEHCDRACAAVKDLDLLKQRELQARTEARFSIGPQEGEIEVTVIDGRRCRLSLSRQTRLREVKEKIQRQLQVPPGQQRLFFRGRDLTKTEEPDPAWGSLGVPFGEALQLVIIMYETGPASGPSVRSLKFDLTWTAVPTRLKTGKVTTHHLNGTCIVLDHTGNWLQAVDFQSTRYPGITHGGPSSIRNPKQSLTVNTTVLPLEARYLFFTLSGFKPGGVTLDIFQNPSVHLRDGTTQARLASYTANQARAGQEAMVLCCAAKDQANGQWKVQTVGVTSSGNKSNYDPLYTTVSALVRRGAVV